MEIIILVILSVCLAGVFVAAVHWESESSRLREAMERERSLSWQHGYDAHAKAAEQANQWRSREEVLKLREEIKRLTELAYSVPPQEGFQEPGSLDLVPVTWKEVAEAGEKRCRSVEQQLDKIRLREILDPRENASQ